MARQSLTDPQRSFRRRSCLFAVRGLADHGCASVPLSLVEWPYLHRLRGWVMTGCRPLPSQTGIAAAAADADVAQAADADAGRDVDVETLLASLVLYLKA